MGGFYRDQRAGGPQGLPAGHAAARFSSILDPQARGRLFLEYCFRDRHGYYEISSNNSTAEIWGGLVNAGFQLLPGLSLSEGTADFSPAFALAEGKGREFGLCPGKNGRGDR